MWYSRLTTSGALDTTFAGDGTVERSLTSKDDIATMLIEPGGKIVLGGSSTDGTPLRGPLIARFNTDGTLDPTFGSGGFTRIRTNDATPILTLQQQPDGSFFAAGPRFTQSATTGIAVLHYTSSGSVDLAFGTGGRQIIPFSDFNGSTLGDVTDVQFDASGRLLVAGGGGIARVLPNGVGDIRFGDNAVSLVTIAGADRTDVRTIVQRPDGTILGIGSSTVRLTSEAFSVAQLLDDAPTSANGVFSITTPTRFVFESAGQITLTVERRGGSAGAVSVPFSTVEGSALAGSDFTA